MGIFTNQHLEMNDLRKFSHNSNNTFETKLGIKIPICFFNTSSVLNILEAY